ncbi:hypothetical protein [Streptomyces geranii]|uniref:hypothetical protein n=1 Tax=Streptomyces geranii TaxID=2058923 RepID=UPI0013002B56|nr:hypothetical protein [Streptomyces geranii]
MLGRSLRVVVVPLALVIHLVVECWSVLEGKVRFVAVLLWSLVVVPIAVSFASRNQGDRWVLASLVLAVISVVLAVTLAGSWDWGGRRTALPGLTAAALLLTAPWLAPWALHDLAGRPASARVVEAEPTLDMEDEDTWLTRYRLADAATGRDLGSMRYGPRSRTPVGAVITVSVVPDGWAEPIATERLDDTDVEPGITAFAALGIIHLLAYAVTALTWPRDW